MKGLEDYKGQLRLHWRGHGVPILVGLIVGRAMECLYNQSEAKFYQTEGITGRITEWFVSCLDGPLGCQSYLTS